MEPYVLITGGAGFIGTNVARSYLGGDQPVHIFDNLSRSGVEQNVSDLLAEFPGRVLFTRGDVRSKEQIKAAVENAHAIYHFAAQVAVTTSLEDPIADAGTNLIGTLNLLEAVRQCDIPPPLLFTSTNKVYGSLAGVALRELEKRYEPEDPVIAEAGIGEHCPLEFLSPYGCSKGGADQYVLDYARSFGLRATVFRMSCIYGPYQRGSEDQGWVAHFVRQSLKGEPVMIFGDGKQVRDLLYIDDLVKAMHRAMNSMAQCAGEAFNLGGGAANSASLLEVLRQMHALTGTPSRTEWGAARPGDQRWYVSDIGKAARVLGWQPEIPIRQGLQNLVDWYSDHPELIEQSAMQEV